MIYIILNCQTNKVRRIVVPSNRLVILQPFEMIIDRRKIESRCEE